MGDGTLGLLPIGCRWCADDGVSMVAGVATPCVCRPDQVCSALLLRSKWMDGPGRGAEPS